MNSKATRTDTGQIVETVDSTDRTEVGLAMNKIIGEVISEVTWETLTGKITEESIEIITKNEGYDRRRNRSRKRSSSRSYNNNRNSSTSNSRSRLGLRASINRDRIGCCKCREYDHFAKDCPTSREEKEIEQLQQMLNLEDEQTSLKSLVTNTQDNFSRVNSEENIRLGHLNLWK